MNDLSHDPLVRQAALKALRLGEEAARHAAEQIMHHDGLAQYWRDEWREIAARNEALREQLLDSMPPLRIYSIEEVAAEVAPTF